MKKKNVLKEAGVLLIVAIMCMTAFAVFPTVNADYPEGIISYWKLDEGSGTVAYDSVDANDGTIYGATWASGQVKGALSFDGVDDYVEVGTVIDVSEQDAITIEAWFNPELPSTVPADSNTFAGIDFGEKTVGHVCLRTMTGGIPKFQMVIERTVLKGIGARALSVFNPGQWYHVVGIVTLDIIELYVDAVLQESKSLDGAPVKLGDITDDRLRIGGGSGDLGLKYYPGILDEVAVYNRALSADEIEYHYCLGYNFGHGYYDPPTLEYTGAPQPTDSVTLEATLTDSTGFGMDGYEIDFYIGDDYVGTSESTGADGVATLDLDSYEIGVYEVYASVHCLESDPAYLAVYDPDAGFVTGGGWIISPAGAYPADPDLTGTANFGFVSKYKKGQSTPTGSTEFQYQIGDLNFHSNDYDWLVITHHKAMYKGTGTINGDGNYGFMISVIDEKLTPSTDVDMFRIKIWDKDNGDAVVYDNGLGDPEDGDPTTAIAGGQIVIHKA